MRRFCSRIVVINRHTHYCGICGDCCCCDATDSLNIIAPRVWSYLEAILLHDLRAIAKSFGTYVRKLLTLSCMV
jgi:hypothetical protein